MGNLPSAFEIHFAYFFFGVKTSQEKPTKLINDIYLADLPRVPKESFPEYPEYRDLPCN